MVSIEMVSYCCCCCYNQDTMLTFHVRARRVVYVALHLAKRAQLLLLLRVADR
jgi:hypothetical protein